MKRLKNQILNIVLTHFKKRNMQASLKVDEFKEINGVEVVQDIEEAKLSVLNGKTVARYEFGDSLFPLVHSGEYLKLVPLAETEKIEPKDIVLCEVHGCLMAHMIYTATKFNNKEYYFIASTHGTFYGWTPREKIYAKCYPFGESMKDRVFVKCTYQLNEQ